MPIVLQKSSIAKKTLTFLEKRKKKKKKVSIREMVKSTFSKKVKRKDNFIAFFFSFRKKFYPLLQHLLVISSVVTLLQNECYNKLPTTTWCQLEVIFQFNTVIVYLHRFPQQNLRLRITPHHFLSILVSYYEAQNYTARFCHSF